jgi:replicative DNA helicase
VNVLPNSPDDEIAIVGGVLLSSSLLGKIAGIVEPSDFYHPCRRLVFEAILSVDADSKPVDVITVGEQLRHTKAIDRLRAVGGEAYLGALVSEVTTTENIAYRARIVAERAAQRRAIEAAQQIQELAQTGDDGWRDDAGRAFFGAVAEKRSNTAATGMQVFDEVIADVERAFLRKQVLTGVPTGFTDLDTLTGGLQASELIILAARPSMGKSALAGSIVENVAFERGIPSLFFTCEMSRKSLGLRMVSSNTRIVGAALKSGIGMQQRDWIQLMRARERFAAAPFVLDDMSSPSLLYVRSKARQWRQETRKAHPEGFGLVVIDYLQLMASQHSQGKNREQEVAELSRGLKALAKELECPVLALSQLNRGVESRADKRPTMGDLRESGAIEQDADVIAFLYRHEVYEPGKDENVAEIIIGKQRNGDTGTVKLRWERECTKFHNAPEVRHASRPMDYHEED